MIMLTDDERNLLHKCHGHIGSVVASPKWGIEDLKHSHASGGGWGFNYTVTKTSLEGAWCNYEVVEWLKDGSPSRLRFDEPHLTVSITFTRIGQWARSLPAELRERARIAYAVYPVDTRDLGELTRITHEAIDLSAPAEQLELFSDLQETSHGA